MVKNYKKGFIIPLVVLLLALLATGIGTTVYLRNKHTEVIVVPVEKVQRNDVSMATSSIILNQTVEKTKILVRQWTVAVETKKVVVKKTSLSPTSTATPPSSKPKNFSADTNVPSSQSSKGDQGFSGFMQSMGCTDEQSCKAFCAKAENADTCKGMFGQNNGGQSSGGTQGDLSYSHVPSNCKSDARPVFSHDITDMSKISSIFPPAHIIGGELKTRAYIHVTDKVPVYAPADGVLVEGSYHMTVDGVGQYALQFQVTCEVRYLFDHMSDPIDAIKNVFPAVASADSRTMGISPGISFKAGDLIGYTTGTLFGKAFDFAVFNTAVPNYFSSQSNYKNNWVYVYAVCPFTYFPTDKKSAYSALFKNDGGFESTPVELCK